MTIKCVLFDAIPRDRAFDMLWLSWLGITQRSGDRDELEEGGSKSMYAFTRPLLDTRVIPSRTHLVSDFARSRGIPLPKLTTNEMRHK
jgi:hypothetical protein